MRRIDEFTNPDSCFNKADNEEPVFVLLARDPSAPIAIRVWVALRIKDGKNQMGDTQTTEALKLADEMEFYRATYRS